MKSRLHLRFALCCMVLGITPLAGCADQPFLNGTEHLVVHFKRSGGGTGNAVAAQVDTDQLAPDDAQALRYMIEDAGFFQLPPIISDVVPHPERYHYTLSVKEETPSYQNHEVVVEEGHVPGKLRPLVHWLMDRAK